jgi:hypothetical protein
LHKKRKPDKVRLPQKPLISNELKPRKKIYFFFLAAFFLVAFLAAFLAAFFLVAMCESPPSGWVRLERATRKNVKKFGDGRK